MSPARVDRDATTARIPAQRPRAPRTRPLPAVAVANPDAPALRQRWAGMSEAERRAAQRVVVLLERYCEGLASPAAVAVALGFGPGYLTPALDALAEQARPWLAWSGRHCPDDTNSELCAPCGDVIRAWWNLRDPLVFEIMDRRGGR